MLLVEKRRDPQGAARRTAIARTVETTSPFLERQRRSSSCEDLETLPVLAGSPLFTDQPPSGLVWLMQQGVIRSWPAGAVVLREGDHSDGLALVIRGEACLVGADGTLVHRGPGETVGEM